LPSLAKEGGSAGAECFAKYVTKQAFADGQVGAVDHQQNLSL